MTDIVERLRSDWDANEPQPIMLEAADAIERLTTLHVAAAVRAEVAQIEVERLRAALNFYANARVSNPSPGRPMGGACDDGYHARCALGPKP